MSPFLSEGSIVFSQGTVSTYLHFLSTFSVPDRQKLADGRVGGILVKLCRTGDVDIKTHAT